MKFSPLLSAVSRTSTLALLFSSVLWLTSCDDDPDPDNVLPELTVTNLADDATVWDVVSISLEASDDRGIDKVEIFVDGSLVESLTEAPFSAEWDTNSLTDGAHTVKVVATDKAGNNVEKEITVTVKNVLVSFTVPENHLWSNEEGSIRGFVFLSDADGKLIKSVEFQNGQDVEIKAPGFKGETFSLTQAIVGSEGDGKFSRLWTFAQIERGKWSLFTDTEEDEVVAGLAKLDYSNILTGTHYELRAPGRYSAYADENTTSSTINLKKSPASLYVTRFSTTGEMPKPAFYKFIPNVVVGANAVSLAQVNIPLTKLAPAIPANLGYVSIKVLASLTADNYADLYDLGNFGRYTSDENFVEVFIPGTAFPSYYAVLSSAESGHYELERGTKNVNQINATPPQYQGNVSLSAGKITSSVTGSFDFLTTSLENPANEEAEWVFILPAGANVSITLPELPEALKGFDVPTSGAPDHFEIHNYENMTDYNTLKSFMRTTAYGLDVLQDPGKEYTWLVQHLDTPEGRRNKPDAAHDLGFSRSAGKN